LQRILSEINDFGAGLVAISPELPDNTLSMAEKNELTFQVLSDLGNSYARQCGLVYALAEELRPLYKNWGIDLPANNGDNTFELPLPATYVVDQNSHIVLSFADADYTKRLEPVDVLDALQRIAAQ
jgi:peroxiredoxin